MNVLSQRIQAKCYSFSVASASPLITYFTQGMATLLPSALYRAESDNPVSAVHLFGKFWSRSHSNGVSLRMSRPFRMGWMELSELPEVPFWSVPHMSPFSQAFRRSSSATSIKGRWHPYASAHSVYCSPHHSGTHSHSVC